VTAHDPHAASPAELQEQLGAERAASPFLVFRDDSGRQRVVRLEGERRLTVGREADAGLSLHWDPQVSRLHAELESRGTHWTVTDDGLSRNGSYVNGERVAGRRRLADGDTLRFGRTLVLFRAPTPGRAPETAMAEDVRIVKLSDAQRRVLVALCRPYKGSPAFATPPTNQEIAAELVLSIDAVKTHLRALFGKFAVEDVPQGQKRARLVERAFLSGLVSERDL
jgi:pSer/pThr/pTyr-binding forkhead associated (FHA) protein